MRIAATRDLIRFQEDTLRLRIEIDAPARPILANPIRRSTLVQEFTDRIAVVALLPAMERTFLDIQTVHRPVVVA